MSTICPVIVKANGFKQAACRVFVEQRLRRTVFCAQSEKIGLTGGIAHPFGRCMRELFATDLIHA
jgi:hypothetical protein